MLNIKQFRELIIRPTLNDLLMSSLDAEELLVFTCANESLGGTYLHQINGPALGIFQIEPETYNDIWQNYILKNQPLLLRLNTNFNINRMPDASQLIYDLRFATAIARIFYARIPEALPSANDKIAMWNYYKTYYNTSDGSATKDAAFANYQNFLDS